MKKQILVLAALFFSIAPSAFAQETSDAGGGGSSSIGFAANTYFDIYGYFGSGSSLVETSANNPSLNQYGIGMTWALNTGGFLSGFGMEYRYIDHASDFKPEDGSYKGERFIPVFLTIGFVTSPFVVKLDYEFVGDYILKNPTVSGAQVIYRNPGGYRLSIMYELWPNTLFGLSYEDVRYRDRLDTANGQIGLTKGFKLSNVAAVIGYAF